ncbi:MAG: hypothetical protein WCJ64_01425 [Rhodospirillaceae bacterium]
MTPDNKRIFDEIQARHCGTTNTQSSKFSGDLGTHYSPEQIEEIIVGGAEATTRRRHCIKTIEYNEYNGVALPSPLSDRRSDATESNIMSLPSSSDKAMDRTQCDRSSIDLKTMDGVDVAGDGWRRAIDEQNERITRLETAISNLIAGLGAETTDDTSEPNCENQIVQFQDKLPDQITLQYFINSGKNSKPCIKLECRTRVRGVNGKPHYRIYQTLYGKCQKDYGSIELGRISKLNLNAGGPTQIATLQQIIDACHKTYSADKNVIASFFYKVGSSEILWDIFVVIDKSTSDAVLLIYNGTEIIEEFIKFREPPSARNRRGACGYYMINYNKIAEIFCIQQGESIRY